MYEHEPVLNALARLVNALGALASQDPALAEAAASLGRLATDRGAMLPAVHALTQEHSELLLHLDIETLTKARAEFRREVARALHTEGAPMAAIAQLFGVTRQRVSAIIADPAARAPAPELAPSAASGAEEG